MTHNTIVPARTNTMHVICIGGSGLRVLRSFVMLLVSGYDIPGYKIKPYIVDPHLQSDDLKFATDLIALYQRIYSQSNTGFLQVPLIIEDLNELNVMKVDTTINQSFGQFIGYERINFHENTRRAIDVLYNSKNLEKSMTVGFKGSPNVGSVVFQDFICSEWFQTHFSNLTQNDRVILIGSLFGGTGASGIPAIARELKRKAGNVPIAAITLTPYFKLSAPEITAEDKEINSDIFNTKSLAALNYYKEYNSGVDTFYVLGDTQPSQKTYHYNERQQGNMAHFIELTAATAIKDFALAGVGENGKLAKWKMFFTKDLHPTLQYGDCVDSMKDVLDALANFYAFSKFYLQMRHDNEYPFNRKVYQAGKQCQNFTDKLAALDELIFTEDAARDSFVRWLGELRDNERSFAPVNTADILSPDGQFPYYRFCPKDPNPVYNGTEKLQKTNMSDYYLAISNRSRKAEHVSNQTEEIAKFLNTCYLGIRDVNSK